MRVTFLSTRHSKKAQNKSPRLGFRPAEPELAAAIASALLQDAKSLLKQARRKKEKHTSQQAENYPNVRVNSLPATSLIHAVIISPQISLRRPKGKNSFVTHLVNFSSWSSASTQPHLLAPACIIGREARHQWRNERMNIYRLQQRRRLARMSVFSKMHS